MESKILIPVIALFTFSVMQVNAADDGAQMFRRNCGACHTVGKGKLVGPDLKGLETRHNEEWILKWIKSSQTLIQAGDKDAVRLFADNSNIPMPDQALNDDQIKTILGFIKNGGDYAITVSSDSVAPQTNTATINTVVGTQKETDTNQRGTSLMHIFSFREYVLMFILGIMLMVIYIMAGSVKSLSEKIRQHKVQ